MSTVHRLPDLPAAVREVELEQPHPVRGVLSAFRDDGMLVADTDRGERWLCDWLDDGRGGLAIGDRVVLLPAVRSEEPATVLGRIGRYRPAAPQAEVRIDAGSSIKLACGEASLELRSDGKVLLKGDDVVVHAKGTQRIRAGTVAIN